MVRTLWAKVEHADKCKKLNSTNNAYYIKCTIWCILDRQKIQANNFDFRNGFYWPNYGALVLYERIWPYSTVLHPKLAFPEAFERANIWHLSEKRRF